MNCPPVPRPLLEWLDRVFPNDLLKLDDASDRQIQRAFGQQEVLKRLRTEYNKQHS